MRKCSPPPERSLSSGGGHCASPQASELLVVFPHTGARRRSTPEGGSGVSILVPLSLIRRKARASSTHYRSLVVADLPSEHHTVFVHVVLTDDGLGDVDDLLAIQKL